MNALQKMNPADYHARKTLYTVSKSSICDFAASPSRFKFAYDSGEKKTTDALAWGSLVDCLFLTPELVAKTYSITSLGLNKNSKNYKELKASAEATGRILVDSKVFDEASKAVMILRHFAKENGIVVGETHESQVAMTYDVEVEGVKLELCGMADLFPVEPGNMVDLKTTGFNLADDEEVRRNIWKYRYHVQAAIYSAISNKIKPGFIEGFNLLMQESKPPYQCRMVRFTEDELYAGMSWFESQLVSYANCLQNDGWQAPLPALEGGLPSWALRREFEFGE